MKNVHIVPHVHWDREWYFTAEESRILLINNMEEIINMLENNKNYPYYVLDGQTSILEDYLSVKPENKDRISILVKKGKLIIGPWYTQTDEMVIGSESIVRNLLYGMKDCKKFGGAMKIGYLPDSFGQSAQIPQILNGFGINYSIFWRGISERKGTNNTEFYWGDDNGNKVLVQLFPLGYAIGKYLPLENNALKTRMDKYFKILDRGATTDNIILPNGHDQMPIQKNIFHIIEKLKELYPDRKFFLSKYENVFKEVEKKGDLPTLKGEFLDGKYMRVHRSIFSMRVDIKSANTRIENKITNILEPLATIAYSLGFEYYSGLIELIWKEILKNHAHDSAGCCCSDKVHREIMIRFFLAEEKIDKLRDFYMRKIVDSINQDTTLDKLTAFNLSLYNRVEVVKGEITTKMKNFILVDEFDKEYNFEVLNKQIIDPGIIDRQIVHYANYTPFIKYTIQFKDEIPSMGYKTYRIKEINNGILDISHKEEVSSVENEFFVIEINKNGTLKIKDKINNVFYDNVLMIEDGADDGDEYDYSPLKNDFIIYNKDVIAEHQVVKNKYSSEIKIKYKLNVPKNLDSRKDKNVDGDIGIAIIVKVDDNKPYMNICFEIDNKVKDHRVRTYIPTGILSKISISDNQFGRIERDVYDSAMDVWEKEQWDERPDPIYPMLSYVTLNDKNKGVAVITNSTREFEIIGENNSVMAITLLRCVGVLGKEELFRRPGRPSGIKLETPDSQLIGKIKLDLALYLYSNNKDANNVARVAKEILTPIVTYNKMPHNAMKLNKSNINCPYEFSLLEEDMKEVTLSTLKKSENNDGLVLRVFNGGENESIAKLNINREYNYIKTVNLNEEVQDKELNLDEIKVRKNAVENIYIAL